MHLRTKFQVSTSTRFGDMLARANYQIHCSEHIKGQNRTAHAPWHVTWGLGVRNNRIFGISEAICLITIQLLGNSGDD